MNPSTELQNAFGSLDIYLFDQLLRGRFDGRRSVLDAGCGTGRNVVYFLRSGFEVFGVDCDPAAIQALRSLAMKLAPDLPGGNFVAGELESLPWPDRHVDAVICSAVLHFATDAAHALRMIHEVWRVLRPGGLFFARLASVIGMEDVIRLDENRRARLPDGTDRFLVDEALLDEWTRQLDAVQLDPIKTTIVQRQRCMSTWVLLKKG